MTRAKVRSSWGQPMLNPESRFLREIPEHLINWRRTDSAPSFSANAPGRMAGGSGSGRVRAGPNVTDARTGGSKRPLMVLEPGDRVSHDKVRAGPRRGGVGHG